MIVSNSTTQVLASVIIVFIIYKVWNVYTYWKRKKIPYISPIIPIGNTLDLLLGKITFGELFSRAYSEFQKRGYKHGGIYYFWQPIYVPVDPEIIKNILICDFQNFTNHGLYISDDDPLSLHIFNMEDKRWKELRAQFSSAFTTTKMREMYTIMAKYSNVFQSNLAKYADQENPVEIHVELSKFSSDVTSACMYSLESKTMQNENPELLKHGRLFFDYQWHILMNTLVLLIPRPILQLFKFRTFTRETEKYVVDLFGGLRDNRKATGDIRNDIADTIIKLSEPGKNGKTGIDPLTPDEFAAQMFVFFVAGFETSSSTQTYAFYELAKNQECQRKLRDEINSVLAKYDNELTYDAIQEMKYLDNVLNETLRIYPVFPMLPRICRDDYRIPGTDIILEKNTAVIISNLGIQHDPQYYPDAEEFDPNRFSTENKYKRHKMCHMPFGAGPRECIGKRFGLLQSKLAIISTIRNFEIKLNEKTSEGVKFQSKDLILRKEGGIWLNLERIS